jgi:hypothetical protein
MIKNFLNWIKSLDTKILAIILLVIVLLISIFGSSYNKTDIIKVNGKPYEVIKHTIDTVLVKSVTIRYVNKFIPTSITDGKIPTILDSSAVVRDYYRKKVYKDKFLLNDKLGYVDIIDTISNNSIISRKYESHIEYPSIKETTIVKELPKYQVYIGANADFDRKNALNNVGTSLLLKTKKDRIYSLGVGIDNDKNIMVGVGVYWKIKL